MENLLLTVKEAAELIRYKEKTIYNAIYSGELPAYGIRGKRLIKKDDLLRVFPLVKYITPADRKAMAVNKVNL